MPHIIWKDLMAYKCKLGLFCGEYENDSDDGNVSGENSEGLRVHHVKNLRWVYANTLHHS